eukprot:m.338131 g.338131  ORF g.338131 m.338131 type:complete len:380 (-) comp18320_c0_seq1:67-1206(-)
MFSPRRRSSKRLSHPSMPDIQGTNQPNKPDANNSGYLDINGKPMDRRKSTDSGSAYTGYMDVHPDKVSESVSDDDYDNQVDLSLIGSSLLGGATIPATRGERQAYIDGVELYTRYIGTMEVPEPRGHVMTLGAMARVRNIHKNSGEKKRKIKLVTSTESIRIFFEDNGLLKDTFPIPTISFIGVHPNNKKVFCIISAHDAMNKSTIEHRLHVFKCKELKQTQRIIETVGRCFTLATELERVAAVEKKKQRRSSMFANIPGQRPQLDRPHLPHTFVGLMQTIRQCVDASAASDEEANLVAHALSDMRDLYHMRERETERSSQEIQRLQGEKQEISQKWKRAVQLATAFKARAEQATRQTEASAGLPSYSQTVNSNEEMTK